jgi:hypothetical protein
VGLRISFLTREGIAGVRVTEGDVFLKEGEEEEKTCLHRMGVGVGTGESTTCSVFMNLGDENGTGERSSFDSEIDSEIG